MCVTRRLRFHWASSGLLLVLYLDLKPLSVFGTRWLNSQTEQLETCLYRPPSEPFHNDGVALLFNTEDHAQSKPIAAVMKLYCRESGGPETVDDI